MGSFEPVAAFELGGSVDGVVEFGESVEGVGVLSEVLVPDALVLLQSGDLGREVVESFLVPLGQMSAVVTPLLQRLLVAFGHGFEVLVGLAAFPPAQLGVVGFGSGQVVVAAGGVVVAGGRAGGMVGPPASPGVEVIELLGGLGVLGTGLVQLVGLVGRDGPGQVMPLGAQLDQR